jgi:Flp pilus assembly protein TadD
LRPDQASIRNTLGVALYRQGEWQEAIDTLKRVVPEGTKSVGRAGDHILIAMSYWQLGNQEEARKWYNDALELIEGKDFSDNEEVRRFRTEAESLLK